MKVRRSFAIGAAVLLCAVIAGAMFSTDVLWLYERANLALRPSAARAFTYGEKHFSAVDTRMYDIDRAAFFFEKAANLDPTTPYVFHELARVAFLRGDYDGALVKINIQISRFGDSAPNSFYIRGLIEGFAGKYEDSIRDYQHFLSFEKNNWAAVNDYAWVLLKAGRAIEAARVTGQALNEYPNNPWLLNSNAIALYEMGNDQQALIKARAAQAAVQHIEHKDWLLAYPGNDPRAATMGIAALRSSIDQNVHTIEADMNASAIQ